MKSGLLVKCRRSLIQEGQCAEISTSYFDDLLREICTRLADVMQRPTIVMQHVATSSVLLIKAVCFIVEAQVVVVIRHRLKMIVLTEPLIEMDSAMFLSKDLLDRGKRLSGNAHTRFVSSIARDVAQRGKSTSQSSIKIQHAHRKRWLMADKRICLSSVTRQHDPINIH